MRRQKQLSPQQIASAFRARFLVISEKEAIGHSPPHCFLHAFKTLLAQLWQFVPPTLATL